MEVASHEYGSFCFAELNTPEPDSGRLFYGSLLGWETRDHAVSSHHYSLFQLQGKDVSGLRWAPRTPHRWIPYVHVQSVDRTAAKARDLGATILGATSGVPDKVRTCVLQDPEGATLGLWETRGHLGACVVNEPGSLWWFELLARDVSTARRFYTALFHWEFLETDKYGNGPYTIFKVGDSSVGGAIQFGADWGVTPRWQVYFAVADFHQTIARATSLGGTLEFEREVPQTGRLGIIRDDRNAVFVVMEPLPR